MNAVLEIDPAIEYRERLLARPMMKPEDAVWLGRMDWNQLYRFDEILTHGTKLGATIGAKGTLRRVLDSRRTAVRERQEREDERAARAAEHAQRSVRTGGDIPLEPLRSVDGVIPTGGKLTMKSRLDIDAIRDATSMSDILQRLGVRRDGRVKAQCVSGRHEDRHFSMHVYEDSRVYCPACDYKADVFGMVCDVHGWDRQADFIRAARWIVGEETGEQIRRRAAAKPEAPKFEQRPMQPLADAARAALWAQATPEAVAGMGYLLERGFSADEIERCGFGVVDSTIPADLLPLTGEGHVSTGWRGRVVIPDVDTEGRVVSLKARTLEAPHEGRKYIKYLAVAGIAPQPYGWQRLAGSDSVLVVEGELDAIIAMEALQDVMPVIAVPGVNIFREEHAKRLVGRRVIVMTDADTQLERCILGDLKDVSDDELGQHVAKGAAAKGARGIVRKLKEAGVDVWVAETGVDGDIGDLLQNLGAEDTAQILNWAVTENARPLRRKVML